MEISILGDRLFCAKKKCRPHTQLLRVMKLTACLLIIACLHTSANSYSQTVSFSGKNVSLQTIFSSIEKQTGLSFFFNYALIKDVGPVTLIVQNIPLEDALNQVLKGNGLDYYKNGKTIFIIKTSEYLTTTDFPISNLVSDTQIDIKGRVMNEQGESLAGATVITKGGKKSTLTDEKGMFELKNVPGNAVLEISYLGYQKQEISADAKTTMRIELKLSNNKLDEAQVIAYGNTTQRTSTGNVSTIKAVDIEKQPVNNPLLALEGRVPGLFITEANGLSGSGVIVRVQGQNSINSGNDPLYVVDGVPYVSQMLATTTGGNAGVGLLKGSGGPAGSGNGNPLSYINPNDIESISVLKDADATAIYGSRAANGAILITTKKGKSGATKVDLNLEKGQGKVTRKLDLLNTQQYLEMRREALKNDNITSPSSTDYDINGLWDTTQYTDWQKVLIGGTAQYTNINGSISGGSSNMQYFLGGSYRKQTTVFPTDFNDQKGSMYFNLNSVSNNQKFKVQFSGSYLRDKNNLPYIDFTSLSITLAPNAPKIYNQDGSLNWAPDASGNPSWTNPMSVTLTTFKSNTNNLLANTVLSYKVFPGLELKSNFGYSNLQTNEFQTNPLISYAPAQRSLVTRSALYTNSTINSWIIEPQVDYKMPILKGKLGVLLGSTLQQNNNNGQYLTGNGYNSDAVLSDIRSASTVVVNSSVISTYKYNAVFGRINYNWLDKYILNFTIRRDGSSRFGPKDQFHNFGALGAAWVFSEEGFVKKSIQFLSFGKFRGSYGITGNDQIGDYQFMNLYTPTTTPVPYQGINGLSTSTLSNPYLRWEETKKLQLGSDLGFFKDRIILTINWVRNRSSNQLLRYALPIITGTSGITENFPAEIQNMAWEFSLMSINIKSGKFSWASSFNLTIPENKLLSFPNLMSSTYASSLIVGQPISIVKAYHLLGVDPVTGTYQFLNSQGKPTSSPSGLTDLTEVRSSLPKLYGGFQNTFNFGDFQLDFLLQFVKQLGIRGSNYSFGVTDPGFKRLNQPISVLERWQKNGDIANIQKYNSNLSLSSSFTAVTASDASFSDASYIRLKNFSLSYQLAERWMRKIGLRNCQLAIHGQNLFTITKFKGIDPENQSLSSLPPLKIWTLGLRVGL